MGVCNILCLMSIIWFDFWLNLYIEIFSVYYYCLFLMAVYIRLCSVFRGEKINWVIFSYVQHHESQCMDQDCLVSWSQHNQTDKEERRLIISRTQGLTITHSKHSWSLSCWLYNICCYLSVFIFLSIEVSMSQLMEGQQEESTPETKWITKKLWSNRNVPVGTTKRQEPQEECLYMK